MTQAQTPEALRLVQWFEDDDGFAHGTKAPHKWVVQAFHELYRQHAHIAQLEAAAVKESLTLAQEKLRADQMTQRLDMANRLGNDARAELAEPEHWVLEHNDPSREFDYTGVKAKAMDWIRIGLNPTPLYPAPQASKPVPLTDAQILKLARLAGYLAGDPSRAAFINGLRAGEKANGIGASNAD